MPILDGMGRPPSRSGPLVAVSIDGKGVAWCDGIFQGDPALVAYAERPAEISQVVRIHDTTLTADPDTPLGALAALAAYSPGRALITEAPDIVLDEIYPDEAEDPAATWGLPDDAEDA